MWSNIYVPIDKLSKISVPIDKYSVINRGIFIKLPSFCKFFIENLSLILGLYLSLYILILFVNEKNITFFLQNFHFRITSGYSLLFISYKIK